MVQTAEHVGGYLKPFGTNRVLNMPYACLDSQRCAPYRVNLLPGQYLIELWGSSGGDAISKQGNFLVRGGRGGYVKGTLNTSDRISLYFYVGAKGLSSNTASYNGGGIGPLINGISQGQGTGGGGATDVRLVPSLAEEDCDDDCPSLKSRLMVAGAGGGACSYINGTSGGDNLGLSGESGSLIFYQEDSVPTAPTGGSQTAPGEGFIRPKDIGIFGYPGGLGRGGGFQKNEPTGAGAGGSGFYGGGSGGWSHNVVSSGAAGSSFVSGCRGCARIDSLPELIDITILGGNQIMPSPLGSNVTGNSGNGFARITVYLGGFEVSRSCRKKTGKIVNVASLLLLSL